MYYGEKFNSITHMIGAALAFIGFGALLTISIQQQQFLFTVSFVVFGLALILMYTSSSLYHSVQPSALKDLFRKLDHVCIYLLIASTYTPYMLVSLIEGDGIVMLLFVWCLALAGIILDVVVSKRIVWLQVIIYLVMGWISILIFSDLEAEIDDAGMSWLIWGGVAYTVGVVFYALSKLKKLNHAHGIWHLFVLLGSVSHFISVAIYVR